MADQFHVMLVNNLTGYDLNPIVPTDPSTFVMPPQFDNKGRFNLVMIQPDSDERHTVLGKFMDAWSKLELAISFLLAGILRIEQSKLTAILNGLGMRGQIDVIVAQAFEFQDLDETQTQALQKLIDRVRESITRRNYLVHGYWLLEWQVRDYNGRVKARATQFRAYSPSNPETRDAITKVENKKERQKYLFSLARIKSLTKSATELTRGFHDFTRANYRVSGKILEQSI